MIGITHRARDGGITDHRSNVGERKPRITTEDGQDDGRGANCKLCEQREVFSPCMRVEKGAPEKIMLGAE